jgi:hypothetical protein
VYNPTRGHAQVNFIVTNQRIARKKNYIVHKRHNARFAFEESALQPDMTS